MAARTTDVAIGLRSRSTRGEFTVVFQPRTLTIELQVPGGCQNSGSRSHRSFNGMRSAVEPQRARSGIRRIWPAPVRRALRIDMEIQASGTGPTRQRPGARRRAAEFAATSRRSSGSPPCSPAAQASTSRKSTRRTARPHSVGQDCDQAVRSSGTDNPSMASAGAGAPARRVVSAISPSKPSLLHSSSHTCGASGLNRSSSSRRTTSSAS